MTGIDPEATERLVGPLAERLEAMHQRIRQAAGDSVRLLPISKGHPVEAVAAGIRLGLREFGESYAQELQGKAQARFEVEPVWHFVGQLQTNKVRLIAARVAVWQSVDRLKVAREIARHAPQARVMIQVNLSGDPNKAGCAFDDLPALVDDVLALGLTVEGLMGVGTAGDDAATFAGFRRLRAAVDAHELGECSMGMTDDLELAIDAGTTMVRVGSALFGPRS